ncbi:hypothetical protein P3T65_26470 [Pseudomonas nitroreducens]|uniref:hypothetical protein n=1 Tax=Pseudomonas nitroreducens TaxID=46680 RepID=UPI0023F83293|nr:hypothetical protein [Pseudomonas nitroreducens]WEW97732.1 hypothetical protein P3T65_26470 [Pseudomonas nitroreducens]
MIKARKGKSVQVGVEAGSEKTGPVVTLALTKTADPDRNGEYDHEVRLELADVAAVIDKLASQGISAFGDEVSTALAGSVRSLNRLLAVASGIQVSQDSRK